MSRATRMASTIAVIGFWIGASGTTDAESLQIDTGNNQCSDKGFNVESVEDIDSIAEHCDIDRELILAKIDQVIHERLGETALLVQLLGWPDKTYMVKPTRRLYFGLYLAEEANGLRVTGLADSGAAQLAGIQRDDLITAVDGKNVTTQAALDAAVSSFDGSTPIALAVTRQGAPMRFDILPIQKPTPGYKFRILTQGNRTKEPK